MTDYVEQIIPGPFFDETFGPSVDPVVGDTWAGTLGQVIDGPFDLGDVFSINVVAGQTFTFNVSIDRSDAGAFFMHTTTADGTTQVDAPIGATSLTFTFTATETGMQEIGLVSTSTTALYSVALASMTVVGPTNGDDVLLGGDAPTTLALLDGNDTWTGEANPEVFVNGQYTDTIYGGLGDDSIFGGVGNDALSGDRDNDLIDGGDGNDNAWGGQGDDELHGGTGLDRLNGNSGHDAIYGGKGGDILQGGKGEDYIEGGGQADKIRGGSQSDEIYGGTGNDVIMGDKGADLIFGGSGGDRISGGTFDDIIYGDHGADRLNGDAGNDEVYGGISDDKLNGNSGDDMLSGDSGHDKLNGGTGNDDLYGGAQGDRLIGGDGEDMLNGGTGDDELTGGADADTFVFAGTVNHDVITDFEVGVDTVDLTSYGPITIEDALALVSQDGDNTVIELGQYGSITLEGVDFVDIQEEDIAFILDEGPVGPVDVDEVIVGTENADMLDGMGGNDTITGAQGDDLLTGGTGEDVFIFGDQSGNDTITDYNFNEDVAVIQGTEFLGIAINDNNVVATHSGGTITFENLSIDTLPDYNAFIESIDAIFIVG